ncbi:MAG: group III truncated hemoglobin [Saprospiraceae bacterium]
MKNIENKEDVKLFVDSFYEKVRIDAKLGPVFAAKIPSDTHWASHLERMYSFWNTVLFGERDYRGNPFSKHATLSIKAPHFDRWIALFTITIDELFVGEKAVEVKLRANKMGMLFQSKLQHLQENQQLKTLV